MNQEQNKPILSKCCGAPRRVCGSDEGTYYYDCQNCGKEFIPQSIDKECCDIKNKGYHTGYHKNCSPTETLPSWMEEEREAWQNWAYNKGFDLETVESMTENNLYWLSRMAEKIEKSKECPLPTCLLHNICMEYCDCTPDSIHDTLVEQGRAEERDRIVTMIEKMDSFAMEYTSLGDVEMMINKQALLDNLKQNE